MMMINDDHAYTYDDESNRADILQFKLSIINICIISKFIIIINIFITAINITTTTIIIIIISHTIIITRTHHHHRIPPPSC